MANGPRMTLASIKPTRQTNRPLRVALYGTAGVGKSTFAAKAPSPVFLCGEDGAGYLDVQAFPKPASWGEVFEAVDSLIHDEHPFKTLVIDTVDGLEPLCWEHVCRSGGKRSIEDFGYGKGYVMALEEWRKLLVRLEWLQTKKGLHLLLLGHGVTKEHKDPEHDPWKRWVLKLNEKSADAVCEWADAVLFATHEALVKKEGLKNRGIATGERLIHTGWTGAHNAKNRYGLPATLPLDWATFWSAVQESQASAVAAAREASEAQAREVRRLQTDLQTLIPQLPLEHRERARSAAEAAGDDLTKLRSINRRVDELLNQAGAARPATSAADTTGASPAPSLSSPS